MPKFLTVFILCLFSVGCSDDVPATQTDVTTTDAVDASEVSTDEGPADISVDNGRLLGPITHVDPDCGVQPMDASGIPGC
jgi:hypothetical protein